MATPAVKRGRVRAQLTKMETEMKKAVEENDRELAEELLDKLIKHEKILDDLNEKIAPTVVEDKQEEENLQIIHYEDIIDRWNTRLRRVINGRITTGVVNEVKEEASLNSSASSFMMSGNSGLNIRLPKFDIPKYSGDVLKWQSFWNTFAAAIHDRSELGLIDKFNYLRSLLTGDALRCIEGLSITPENYSVAVERLTKRFGRTDQIIDSTMTSLARLNPPKNDHVSLRNFFDEVDLKLLGLKSLKVDINACGAILRPLLVKLLPNDIQIAWVRQAKAKSGTSEPKLEEFVEFLREEVELRERVQLVDERRVDRIDRKDERNPNRVKASTAALNVMAKGEEDSVRNKTPARSCQICGDRNHGTSECEIKSLSERYERLKKRGRCFNCLWQGHMKFSCPRSTARCHHCKKDHHSALCPQKLEPSDEKNAESRKATESSDVSTNHVVDNVRTQVVYLQTAQVKADGNSSSIRTWYN